MTATHGIMKESLRTAGLMALVLYSGEKHGVIVKPEDKKDEWIGMVNNQIKWYRQASPENPNSAEVLYKESIVMAPPNVVDEWVALIHKQMGH